MASSKVYETFPVHPGSMEIRFLELRPPFSDVLSCKLSVVTLKSGPPPFIALSYEWGADDANHVMSLDGHDVSIRHNLWLALKNITKHHARLVQDYAICIDQDNIPERNHQVDLMRDIYSSAALVLVWLGPAADDSAFAIRNIRYEKPGTGLVRKEFLAVHRLLCRTYWERMWIVQEFILGRSVLVHCGDG
ncbi:HET-domain-containing protein, partial [Lophium mytilinum]